MENSKTAVLFLRLPVNEDLTLLVPTSVIVGEVDDKNLKFYDSLSGKVYVNSDVGFFEDQKLMFSCVKDLEEIKQQYEESDAFVAVNKYYKDVCNNAYYYSCDNGKQEDFLLKTQTREKFQQEYGILLEYGYVENNNKKFSLPTNPDSAYDAEVDEELELDINNLAKTIKPLYEEITKNVLCQDNQVKKLLTAVYKNLLFNDPRIKSNVFLYGPTGVGKTEILRQISNNIGLPMVVEDSTRYTIAGYQGESVEKALVNLFYEADENLELAQHGILVFDEIDKKAKKSHDTFVSSEGVLNSLLKIIEGEVFNIELDKMTGESIRFDTSGVTLIVSGAFTDMNKKESSNFVCGFSQSNNRETKQTNLSARTVDDFVKYGMPQEFMGRFNSIIGLNELKKEDLKKILLSSKTSPLKIYREKFKEQGITLRIPSKLIDLICEKVYNMHTGARALNTVVSEVLDSALFDLFQNSGSNLNLSLKENILNDPEKGYQLTKKNSSKNKKNML